VAGSTSSLSRPTSLRRAQQALKQILGLPDPADAVQRVDEPEGAGQEGVRGASFESGL
jgi:hypothetical protein